MVIAECYRLTGSSCAVLTRASISYRNRLLKRWIAGSSPEVTVLTSHAATRFPICAKPERLPPSRPCLFGAVEFRPGARGRWTVPAAHRGYRRDAMPAGIRGCDLRRPRMVGDMLGNAGASAIPAFFELPRRGRKTGGRGPD